LLNAERVSAKSAQLPPCRQEIDEAKEEPSSATGVLALRLPKKESRGGATQVTIQ